MNNGTIELPKGAEFDKSTTGYIGIGVDAQGRHVAIFEDGTTARFSYEGEYSEFAPKNTICNLGVGLLENLPTPQNGFTYATTDTFEIYEGIEGDVYQTTNIDKGQFVTDNFNDPNTFYQYTGVELLPISSSSGGTVLASNVVVTPPSGFTSTDQQSFDAEVAGNTLKGNTTTHTPIVSDSVGVWDSVAGLFKRMSITNLVTLIKTLLTTDDVANTSNVTGADLTELLNNANLMSEVTSIVDTDEVLIGRYPATHFISFTNFKDWVSTQFESFFGAKVSDDLEHTTDAPVTVTDVGAELRLHKITLNAFGTEISNHTARLNSLEYQVSSSIKWDFIASGIRVRGTVEDGEFRIRVSFTIDSSTDTPIVVPLFPPFTKGIVAFSQYRSLLLNNRTGSLLNTSISINNFFDVDGVITQPSSKFGSARGHGFVAGGQDDGTGSYIQTTEGKGECTDSEFTLNMSTLDTEANLGVEVLLNGSLADYAI